MIPHRARTQRLSRFSTTLSAKRHRSEPIDPGASTWLVEARVVLRNPHQASERSRRDFFEAIRSIQGEERPAEVGWAGDYMAFVSVTRRAQTPEGAAQSLRRLIKRAATGGARWRLTTGLEVEILAMLPAD